MAPGQEASVFVAPRPVRVLSNSAAEFVETRAGSAICRRATGPVSDEDEEKLNTTLADVQFVSQLDAFLPKDEVPNKNSYYQESSEMLLKFEETLKRFTQTLQSRDVFKKLGIEACDPAKCDINYVLKIATVIHEHKQGVQDTQQIKKFMRRCVRRATANKAAIEALLSMVPNDVYGSVISGGFSLILAAVEKHESNRAEIQSILADIPRKLDSVRRLSEVSVKWPAMHRCADQIFLSIFVVLERIINKLSMNTIQKGVLKMKGYGGDVNDAIEDLGTKVKEFQDEATTCSMITIGRAYECSQKTQIMVNNTHDAVQKLLQAKDELKSMLTSQSQAQEAHQGPGLEKLLTNLYNSLYQQCAADERFDAINGIITTRSSTKNSVPALPPPQRKGSILFSLDENQELVDTWLSGLGDLDPMSDNHITQCLSGFPSMSPEEMDRVQWVTASEQLNEWLSPTRSCVLDLHSETAPDELVNAMSFCAATLAFSLARATQFAVLSFFCGIRTKESRKSTRSGPAAIRNSLNGQLLKFLLARQAVDLSFLEQKKLMKKSQAEPKYARALLKKLFRVLPDRDVVFIMIDSFSSLGGTAVDYAKGDELIRELIDLGSEFPQLVIKLLVTDSLSNCPVRKLADQTLCVPDDVDGGASGVNLQYLDGRKTVMIKQLARKREEGSGSESDDGSESSSSSSGSDLGW